MKVSFVLFNFPIKEKGEKVAEQVINWWGCWWDSLNCWLLEEKVTESHFNIEETYPAITKRWALCHPCNANTFSYDGSQVVGMRVKEEWVRWRDEDKLNFNMQGGSYPAVTRSSYPTKDTKLYYCYYMEEPNYSQCHDAGNISYHSCLNSCEIGRISVCSCYANTASFIWFWTIHSALSITCHYRTEHFSWHELFNGQLEITFTQCPVLICSGCLWFRFYSLYLHF